jgi:hypothetical protein
MPPKPRSIPRASTQQHQYYRVSSQKPRRNVNFSVNHTWGPPSPCLPGGRGMGSYILLINRSLFTPFAPLPFPFGISVHISFTFSSTMLQCRSKALTRARSFLLLRHEMRTWVWERTAVWRMERGPAESSCSSMRAISYSLRGA